MSQPLGILSPWRSLARSAAVLASILLVGVVGLGNGQHTRADADGLAPDDSLIAAARGWTRAEVQAYGQAESWLDTLTDEVMKTSPDSFVGSILLESPSDPPMLLLKGKTPDNIAALVAAGPVRVVVLDDQPYSFAELEERQLRVHWSLTDRGFEVATSADIRARGTIHVRVVADGSSSATVEAVLSAIPVDLRASTLLTFVPGPLLRPEAAFGGMWLKVGPNNACTSGWAVANAAGLRGISGAGHCNGITKVTHPGEGDHDLTFQAQHEGQWGDVEWYTSTVFEPDDFYSDATTIRDVGAVEARWNISVGESICGYGRASNVRDCTLDVNNNNLACGHLSRMVEMNGEALVPGDSGGGWSFGVTAYGAHYGNCGSNDMFSVADLFDEAIGVSVLTQ